MSKDKNDALNVIARGEWVMLRDWLATDVEPFVRWLAQGEWQKFDAPWETAIIDVDEEKNRKWLEKHLKNGDDSWFNKRAVIAKLDNTPLGWVNHYGEEGNPDVFYVGIAICEDAFLNRGMGTEALKLWIDYLFTVFDMHKLSLDTCSFNPRMVRVAEKVGFEYEGCQREMQQWQGEWLDRLHFGILRTEWQDCYKGEMDFYE